MSEPVGEPRQNAIPEGTRPDRRWPTILAALAAAVLAGAIALHRISEPMPWADEMQTLGYCTGSWAQGLHLATHTQNMPVGYWLISKTLFSLTGLNIVTMRVVSALSFMALAAAAVVVLRRWLPLAVALGVGLLIATHPALVWHARDGRVYMLLLLAQAASVALLTARPFKGREPLWIVVTTLAVYLHHHSLLLVVIEALILFDRGLPLRRALAWVAALSAPDLILVYLAMQTPNVASQLAGTGQTFAPNVLLALDRLGTGVSEMIPLPIEPLWRKLIGGGLILVPSLITIWRGRAAHGWLGIAVLALLVVPAAVHDAMDVFYEPRFVVLVNLLVLVWLGSCLTLVAGRWGALAACLGLVGLFGWVDRSVVRPQISPYRPTVAAVNDDIADRPGKIVMHPGYLVGCWFLPDGFDTAGGVVLSETGAMVGEEKQMADDHAVRYPSKMPWSRFRAEIVGGTSFTLMQGNPALYPRQHVDFCQEDEPWATGYRLERLYPDHPFVTIIRFEAMK